MINFTDCPNLSRAEVLVFITSTAYFCFFQLWIFPESKWAEEEADACLSFTPANDQVDNLKEREYLIMYMGESR
jgi:hypothetical protein